MIKRLSAVKIRVLFFALLFSLASLEAFSQGASPFSQNESPLPAPTGFVNDFVGVLDAGTKQQLETRIKEFKEKDQSAGRTCRRHRQHDGRSSDF
ncbi:MAG: hypothetical protein WKF71_01630 [Pyrinomonadaceae bacterium]